MSSVTITLLKPHPKQEEFLRNRLRFNVLKCGRRFGKTQVCQILISEIIQIGGYVGYWSPTYKALSEVWRETKNTFNDIIVRKDEQLKEIEFIGGAKVDFWSMDDPDSGRGRKYHRAIMDECEMANRFQDSWELTIRATLVDFAGDAYFLSTPKFGDTYFKQICKYQDTLSNWKTFIYTTYDNPHIPLSEIEEARDQAHPTVFDCEYLALDVDGKTLNPFAYQFDEAYHVSDTAIFAPSKPIIISIDFNLQPFAVSFSHFWQDKDGIHDHTFDEAEIQQGSIPAMADLIKARYGKYLWSAQITGDFMGRRGDLSQRDNASLYTQLVRLLGMGVNQIHLPKDGNPTHENSKADTNFVLWKSKTDPKWDVKINPVCKNLVRDMKTVQWDDLKSEIKKRNRNDLSQRADLCDTFRYKINLYHRPFISKERK